MAQSPELLDEQTYFCEFCGRYIEEPDQECPALDDGRCAA